MTYSVLITGAANGLGRALAHRMYQLGKHVVAMDVDQAGLKRLQKQLPAVSCISIDLEMSSRIEDVMEEISDRKFDTVIHAAAISATGRFEDIPSCRLASIIEVNLCAPLLLSRHLVDKNLLLPMANLIFISSLSKYTTYPGGTVYAGTKDGIAQFARSLSKNPHNLNIMCVFPGPMNTGHATRYAPVNDMQITTRRMDCFDVADEILLAAKKNRRICIPGRGNRAIAVLARLMPGLVSRTLVKTLFAKMDHVRI